MPRREKQSIDSQSTDKNPLSLNADLLATGSAATIIAAEAGPTSVLYPAVTLEIVLYVAVIALAALLRFFQLDRIPLEANESVRALSAWQLTQFAAPAGWDDPLATFLTSVCFMFLGANDTMARLMPALFGSALVGLPWLLRNLIGRTAALTAAFLLAASPSLIYYSRTLSGEIFSLFLFFALVCLAANWQNGNKYLIGFAAGLGLLFASGGTAVSYLIVGALALVVLFSASPNNGLLSAFRAQRRESLVRLGTAFLAPLVLVTTAFFSYFNGLSVLNLSSWLEQFDTGSGLTPWYFPFESMMLYEPALAILGLCGLVFALRNARTEGIETGRRQWNLFLVLWAVVGLVLAFASGEKSGAQLMFILPPLAIGAGMLVQGSLARINIERLMSSSRLAVSLLPAVVFSLLLLAQFSNSPFAVTWYQWGLLSISLGITFGSTVVAVGQNRWGSTAVVAILGVFLIVPYTVHANSWLNYRTSGAEILPAAVPSTALKDSLANISRKQDLVGYDKDFSIAVDEDLQYPFAWYLRDYKKVTFSPLVSTGPTVVITTENDKMKTTFDGYRPIKTVVSSRSALTTFVPAKLWRWLIYREAIGEGDIVTAITYIKE